MPRLPILALLLLAPAACKQAAGDSAEPPPAQATAVADGAKAEATASSGARKSVKAETETYIYEYEYPAAAAAIPGLAAWLDADGQKARDELAGEAQAAKEESADGSFPFHKHSFMEEWDVVADLPGWLSLSGDFSTFSGGAHGMYGLEGYVWDKANNRGFPSEELFQSADYLGAYMDNRVCDALNRERAKRRGEAPNPDGDDMFDQCPDLSESTVLVGSSNGKTFDRITVWFGPYVAGPYAEGAYELDFPMTAQMLDAVKPAYRGAFSVKR